MFPTLAQTILIHALQGDFKNYTLDLDELSLEELQGMYKYVSETALQLQNNTLFSKNIMQAQMIILLMLIDEK